MASKRPPTSEDGQYLGDFWGLHLAFENYDGAFLERLGLPKGNLYKLSDKVYEGPRQLRYQGPNAVDDASDYENIRWNLDHTASADFIRDFLDCDEWYRYHTVTEAIRHYDIFSGATCWHCLKNSAWYFYPDYNDSDMGKLQFLPFDTDDTWGPYFNMGVDHAKAAIFDQYFTGGLYQYPLDPNKAPLKQAYRNRIREFWDLHWQPEVINGMIDELAAHIEDFVPADRDRWRLDRTEGRTLDNGTLEECVELMKQFAWESGRFQGNFYWMGTDRNLDSLAGESGDSTSIPDTPTIEYVGSEGYPIDDLWFSCSVFSDPQGDESFAALCWRIAEYELNYQGTDEEDETLLNIADENWCYFKGEEEPSDSIGAWVQFEFDDSHWKEGQTPLGFGDNTFNTSLAGRRSSMEGNYFSVYLRNRFEISEVNDIETFHLRVYVDDGCIIWINGTEVARLHCNNEDKQYNSLTGAAEHEANAYENVYLTAPHPYLRNGTNVIAVHALQDSYDSDDFAIDVAIDLAPEEYEIPTLSRSKYELQALWQSEEITDPCNTLIQIPSDSLQPNHTYRVRNRMMDDTGRWSHWSDPIEFIAGSPLQNNLQDYLRLTELMYHPTDDPNGIYDDDDFEFIELTNISTDQILDLSTVSLCDGVNFSFADGPITQLGPGIRILLVSHRDAFLDRYDQSLAGRIAGVYSGSLSNGGERVELADSQSGTLQAFTYRDDNGWPQAPDGNGHSLVPLSDYTSIELHDGILDDPTRWTSSPPSPGS